MGKESHLLNYPLDLLVSSYWEDNLSVFEAKIISEALFFLMEHRSITPNVPKFASLADLTLA